MARSALAAVTLFFDLSARRDVLAAEVEFLPLTGEVVVGPDGVTQALDDIAEQFRIYDVRPEAMTPVGDEAVLVELRREGLTHRGEFPLTDRFAQVFSVRDGQIVRIESFKTLEAARQAIP